MASISDRTRRSVSASRASAAGRTSSQRLANLRSPRSEAQTGLRASWRSHSRSMSAWNEASADGVAMSERQRAAIMPPSYVAGAPPRQYDPEPSAGAPPRARRGSRSGIRAVARPQEGVVLALTGEVGPANDLTSVVQRVRAGGVGMVPAQRAEVDHSARRRPEERMLSALSGE